MSRGLSLEDIEIALDSLHTGTELSLRFERIVWVNREAAEDLVNQQTVRDLRFGLGWLDADGPHITVEALL